MKIIDVIEVISMNPPTMSVLCQDETEDGHLTLLPGEAVLARDGATLTKSWELNLNGHLKSVRDFSSLVLLERARGKYAT